MIFYYLEIVECFDRPHLSLPRAKGGPFEHPAFARVAKVIFAGHSHRSAVAQLHEHMHGEWDFDSSYVARAELYSTDRDGRNRRTVRVRTYRVRDAGAERAVTVASEREQFARSSVASGAWTLAAATSYLAEAS